MRIRNLVVSIALVAVGIIPSGAGSTPRQSAAAGGVGRPDKAKTPDSEKIEYGEIEVLAADARAAAPELAADILLRVVESGSAISNASKADLIKESFSLASKAQHPVKRRSLPSTLADTRSGYLSKAFSLGLDQLSLQCRAVKAMLAIDKQGARELFAQVPELKLQPISCEDALVYDASEYYDTLARVARGGFSKKELARGENVRFIEAHVRAIESPAQVGPAALTIAAQNVTAPQMEGLVHAYTQVLGTISYDDRSFSNSVATGSFVQGVEALIEACKKQDVSRDDLLEAVRRYVIKGVNGTSCGDVTTQTKPPDIIEYFNGKLRLANLPSRREVAQISEEDIKPAGTSVKAKAYLYWQSAKSKELLTGIKRLRFGSGRTEFSEEEKEKPEWQSMLTDYLNDLATWDPEEEKSETDYFHQKSVIFRGLVEVCPPGPTRDRVTRDYVVFLSYSKLQQTDAIEWFLHARYVLEKASRGEWKDKILDAMSKSASAALHSYAGLERLLPQPRDKTL